MSTFSSGLLEETTASLLLYSDAGVMSFAERIQPIDLYVIPVILTLRLDM